MGSVCNCDSERLKPVEEQRSEFRDLERNKVVVTSFVVYNVWLDLTQQSHP